MRSSNLIINLIYTYINMTNVYIILKQNNAMTTITRIQTKKK